MIFDCSEHGSCAVNFDIGVYQVLPNILEMCQPAKVKLMLFGEGL